MLNEAQNFSSFLSEKKKNPLVEDTGLFKPSIEEILQNSIKVLKNALITTKISKQEGGSLLLLVRGISRTHADEFIRPVIPNKKKKKKKINLIINYILIL